MVAVLSILGSLRVSRAIGIFWSDLETKHEYDSRTVDTRYQCFAP